MQAARAKSGDVKLCGFPPKVRRVLEMTHLLKQFEIYDSLEEAITAAYLGSRYSREKRETPGLGCFVFTVRSTCVRFCARFCAMPDSMPSPPRRLRTLPILLKATKAKLVVVSSRIQFLRGKPVRAALAGSRARCRHPPLDEAFATQDPGDAAEKLLNRGSERLLGARELKRFRFTQK